MLGDGGRGREGRGRVRRGRMGRERDGCCSIGWEVVRERMEFELFITGKEVVEEVVEVKDEA